MSLEDTLKRISHDFANEVVAALMKLPFEAWYEDVQFDAPKPVERGRPAKAEKVSRAAKARTHAVPSEMETSILEHLNEAGPTGSTVRAWVISTQGELPHDEHTSLEAEANGVLEALESKGLIHKRAFSRSRGQVYALAPV